MQTIDCKDWQEFKDRLEVIKREVSEAKQNALPGVVFPELLYRGHADSAWKLETTLERSKKDFCDFSEYYRLILGVKSEVETFFEKKWHVPDLIMVINLLKDDAIRSPRTWIGNTDQLYEYMVFLRHYGFPSPLLDWSRSPYVAAFFATRGFSQSHVRSFSIFVFLDNVGHGKTYSGKCDEGLDRIEVLGPNVKGQARHFLQQCEYTICTKQSHLDLKFICHEEIVGPSNVVKFTSSPPQQDLLIKFNIPIYQLPVVRQELHAWNLNAFSLFASDDAFVEAIASRAIFLK